MNIALILAGGTGERTGQAVPKQFLTFDDMPVIVYTLNNLNSFNKFDEIYVVCSNEWKMFVSSYAKQYNIDIFRQTIPAGSTRFESMYNGFDYLSTNHFLDDIVCVFDANRPMIPHKIIDDCLNKLAGCDCVLPLEDCFDSMYLVDNNNHRIEKCVDRSVLYNGQTPETTKIGIALEILNKAKNDNKNGVLTDLMLYYEKKVDFVKGSPKSLKITTSDDFAIFKALIKQ